MQVTRENHSYLQDIETREEGGTPSVVGSIRAGLVFQMKEAVTSEAIMKRDEEIIRYALFPKIRMCKTVKHYFVVSLAHWTLEKL